MAELKEMQLHAVAEMILLRPWLSATPACVLLQVVALSQLRGALRSISIILTVVTTAFVGLAGAAYAMDPGNLWQLFLIMGTPPLLVVTVGILLMGAVVSQPVRR